MGGLWSAWLFWFFEALVCVSGKTKCAKCVGKKFPFLCVGYFLFFSVSDCCLVRCRSVGSGSRPVIATNVLQLPKGGDFGALHCQMYTNIDRSTKLDLTTESPLLVGDVSGSLLFFSSLSVYINVYFLLDCHTVYTVPAKLHKNTLRNNCSRHNSYKIISSINTQ